MKGLPARPLAALVLAWIAAAVPAPATAAFEVAVAPSRIQLSGSSGERIGRSLEIQNVGAATTEVALRTIDWRYAEDGGITYHDELLPGSCRPWVTLERRSIRIEARGKRTLRFQIDVPAGAGRHECRFMLAVEGVEPAFRAALGGGGGANLALPITGRIAVAVYVDIGGAAPRLEMTGVKVGTDATGRRTAALTVRNTGDAHGRLGGSLDATDATGRAFDWVPEGTPVMPGQTRDLALVPRGGEDGRPVAAPVFPVRTRGAVDWEDGSFTVEAEFR